MNKIHRLAALALVLGFIPAAWAADKRAPTEAQRRYQEELANCTGGKSQQDRDTCLKEAQNAYAEARGGVLGTATPAELARNATRRCEAQPVADRAACEQRILGVGSTQGSVNRGGLLRRTETRAP